MIPINSELSAQEGLRVSLMGAQEGQDPGTEGLRVMGPHGTVSLGEGTPLLRHMRSWVPLRSSPGFLHS